MILIVKASIFEQVVPHTQENPQAFDLALTDWKHLLGSEHVVTSAEQIKSIARTTFKTEQNVLGILYPKNTSEVIQCVKIANQYEIALYPVSTGNNFGLGNAVPCADNNVIIHLGKMNKILEFDEEMGCITVEPGVTQKQISQFLNEKNSKFMFGVTGSAPETSAIGNTAERGDCASIEPERANVVCNLSVVLPNGDYIETGFGAYKNAKTKQLSRWGLGPSYDGMFLQSNLGIITKATFWLTPKPKYIQYYVFVLKDATKLNAVVNRLRELKQTKFIPNNVYMWNKYKLFSIFQRYPWDMTNETPLPDTISEELSKKYHIGEWVGIIPLYASSKLHAKAQKKLIKAELRKHVDSLLLINKKTVKLFDYIAKPINKIFKIDLAKITMLFKSGILTGNPAEAGLSSIYWRKKKVPEKLNNLLEDNCGLFWGAFAIPFKGDDATKACEEISRITLAHGFEPNLALLGINERIITLAVALVYDRDLSDEDKKAEACYFEVFDYMIKAGYIPNRIAINSFDKLPATTFDYYDFNVRIKNSLDPKNILAPNRYISAEKKYKATNSAVSVALEQRKILK